MDFRGRAKEHRRLSFLHFNNTNYDCFPAACVELRMAIECIAYQIFESYVSEFSNEIMDTWQPGKLIEELKKIDQHVDKDGTLSVGSNDAEGSGEMHVVGTDRRPSLPWLRESYNALGSFVHERTVKQIKSGRLVNLAKRRKKFEEIGFEVDRILSGNLWNMNLKFIVSVECACGFLIQRRESFLEKDGQIICANCGELYRAQKQESDGDQTWIFFLHKKEVRCPHGACKKTQFIAEKYIRSGYSFSCEHCNKGITFKSGLFAAKGSEV